jgi:ABC-type multidrug transport system fused ATPase/permease subunit
LVEFVVLYLLVSAIQAIGRYGWRYFLIRTSMMSGRDLRDRYSHHLFALTPSFFDRKKVGDLMSLATSDIEAIRMAMGGGMIIFLDAGYGVAQTFIAEQLFHKTDEVVAKRLWQDAKSRFQEIAQEKVGITPNYQLMHHIGPDHARTFTVGAFLGTERIAVGEGKSKQEAEQQAAEKALEARGW